MVFSSCTVVGTQVRDVVGGVFERLHRVGAARKVTGLVCRPFGIQLATVGPASLPLPAADLRRNLLTPSPLQCRQGLRDFRHITNPAEGVKPLLQQLAEDLIQVRAGGSDELQLLLLSLLKDALLDVSYIVPAISAPRGILRMSLTSVCAADTRRLCLLNAVAQGRDLPDFEAASEATSLGPVGGPPQLRT